MSDLHLKNCIPCQGGVPPLPLEKRESLLENLGSDWFLIDNNSKLERNFTFKDFKDALDFTNKIGKIAEEQWHHPDITLGFGYLIVKIWTHKIDSLVESDFILAAKIDKLFEEI